MKCPNCKKEIVDMTLFCPKCGYKIGTMKSCPHCGTLNPQDAKFCTKCCNEFECNSKKEELDEDALKIYNSSLANISNSSSSDEDGCGILFWFSVIIIVLYIAGK